MTLPVAWTLKHTRKLRYDPSLVTTIESLYRFKTGLTPPLTFGPAHHTGTSGAFLLRVDREAKALREPVWVE